MWIVTDSRGATVGVYDAPTLAAALDLHAVALGYPDDDERWVEEGPWEGRIYHRTAAGMELAAEQWRDHDRHAD